MNAFHTITSHSSEKRFILYIFYTEVLKDFSSHSTKYFCKYVIGPFTSVNKSLYFLFYN